MTSHRFVDLLLQSFTGCDSVAMEFLPCFSVFAFQISSSARGSTTIGFDRLALNADVETNGSHSALGCSFNSFNHCSWSKKEPLSLSAKFPAQSELKNISASSALPLSTKADTTSSFFLKAFEPILRHVLRDKMTPLYLVICFVTSYSRMTRLSTGN